MTTRQLDKMRQGREAQLERERAQHHRQLSAYMDWLKAESATFSARLSVAALEGRGSDEFKALDSRWHELLRKMPTPPPASAWPS